MAQPFERYIGKVGLVIKNGWIKDYPNNKRRNNRVRGYVHNPDRTKG